MSHNHKMSNKFTNNKALLATVAMCAILAGCSDKPAPNTSDGQQQTASQTKPLKRAKDLAPYSTRPIQDEVFYFVMPDRFANGNKENDLGSKIHAISAGGFDPTHKGMYHGGDIAGLEQKLPYLEAMGVSAIWLTPILRNQAMQADTSGYHGYWVLDFTEIDPHLGSNDDLKSLIKAAHEKNIKVFFDIIANHTADVIKFTQCHGDDGKQWLMQAGEDCPYKSLAQLQAGDSYDPVIPAGSEALKTPAWLNDPKYYHNQGDSDWVGESSLRGDFAGLDDLNTEDPRVVAGLIDIFKNLITEFKPDGFRIDTVKHVNTEFWAEFAPSLVAHAKEQGIEQFFMFGEVYAHSVEVLSEYTTKGKMQSVLDFGFQQALSQTLIEQQGTDKFAQLFAQDDAYNDEDSNADQLLTFTGNHDMGRFAHLLSKSKHQYNEEQLIQRTVLAHAMMYFMRGVPIVYYGDEQGFIGDGHDQDSRQDMMKSYVASYNDDNVLASAATTADDNFDVSHPFYQLFAQYADLYFEHPVLRYGKQRTLYAQTTPGVFAISRKLPSASGEAIVVFNTSGNTQQVTLDVSFDRYVELYQSGKLPHAYDVINKQMNVAIPGLSFAIYHSK